MKHTAILALLLLAPSAPAMADKNLNQAAEYCGVTNWKALTKRQKACIEKRTAWYLARQDKWLASPITAK